MSKLFLAIFLLVVLAVTLANSTDSKTTKKESIPKPPSRKAKKENIVNKSKSTKKVAADKKANLPKPPSRNRKEKKIAECDKKFNNSKMFEEYTKKARLASEKKAALDKTCAKLKKEIHCKKAKALAPKIAFYKQEAKKFFSIFFSF